MVHVLIHHKVADFNAWKENFDSAFNFRHAGGETAYYIYRDCDDPNSVTMMCEWESLEHAKKFFASEQLKSEMRKAGVQGEPRVHYMVEVRSMRRTSAD
jgi:quinol monooxygenase YgiN